MRTHLLTVDGARPSLRRAALIGGGAAGGCDILYAFAAFGAYGVSPQAILHSIASGLLGKPAYHGGTATAVLGLALHFGMATIMAALFAAAARSMPRLVSKPIAWGIVYGLAVYLVMNKVVVPLSAFPGGGGKPTPLPLVVGGLAIHAFGVGVPIALAARRFAVAGAARLWPPTIGKHQEIRGEA